MDDHGYGEGVAALYDARVPEDRGDVAFYRDLAESAPGPALELAAGTGRVYLDLLAAGVDVDGLDASPEMLGALRAKAAERDLDPTVWVSELSAFAVEREYGLVYCPFHALQHCRSVDEQVAVFERAYDALAPGGTFAFDVFVPDFDVIEEYGEWVTERVEYRGDPHEVRHRSRIVDDLRQEFLVEVELRDPDGERVLATEHRLAFLPYPHLELLARLSPFEDWSVAGDFDGTPIEDGDDLQVWTFRKSE